MYAYLEEIKNYLNRRFSREPASVISTRQACENSTLPVIQVPIYVGKILYLLAKMKQPKKILEIGTLGGYSTAWFAQALTSKEGIKGKLISLEINPIYAELAKQNLEKFHLQEEVEVRIGHAIDLLAQIVQNGEGPFDVIFIDADKENYPLYLDWALQVSHADSLILIDNLLPKGEWVGQPMHEEAKSIYAFNDYLAQHAAIETAVLPIIARDGKRIDGLGIIYPSSKKIV